MKEEIKEILNDLRKTADNTIFAVCSSQEELDKMPRYTANFMSINDRKAKLLLDYITNLQEENKSYLRRLDEAYEREDTYKSRIDKAIEYINHAQNYGTMAQVMPHLKPYVNGDDLLNILQGEDKECMII